MSYSVHDRLTMAMMLKSGRRSRAVHRAIMIEVNRLDDRLEALRRLKTTTGKVFVAGLADEQEHRLEHRIDVLLRGHQFNHIGRPRADRMRQ